MYICVYLFPRVLVLPFSRSVSSSRGRFGARLLHAAGRRLDSAAVPGCAELGGGAAGETIGAAAERRKVVGFSGKHVAMAQNYGTNDPQTCLDV